MSPMELCWGTVQSATIETLVEVASENGFESVTVTPWMGHELLDEPDRLATVRRSMKASGVRIGCLDAVMRGLPGVPGPDEVPESQRQNFTYDAVTCLRIAEALDIGLLNITHYLGTPVPLAALVEAIGLVAQRAAECGVATCIEFIPGTGIPDLATAAFISSAIGANIGLLVDSWHLARTGGSVTDLRALPPGSVRSIQLNDRRDGEGGPVDGPDGLVYLTMASRRLPGDGELPLAEIVSTILANSPGLPVGIEVFSDEMRALSPQAAASRAAEALQSVLSNLST
jgi:sugar phosphate isomerase/epimerase